MPKTKNIIVVIPFAITMVFSWECPHCTTPNDTPTEDRSLEPPIEAKCWWCGRIVELSFETY